MKIKRFTGSDMKLAMRNVREHWGTDAVILASKRLDDGVEITAAIDFDEDFQEQIAKAETAPPALTGVPESRPDSAAKRQTLAASNIHKDKLHDIKQDVKLDIRQDARQGVKNQINKTPKTSDNAQNNTDKVLAEMRTELVALRGLLEEDLSQLAWRELAKQHPLRAKLNQRLVDFGLDRQFASRLTAGIKGEEDLSTGWKKALLKISHMLPAPNHNILKSGGTIAVVGATGVGKTTSVAKLAGLYALEHGRDQVGLVTTDCFRVGGHEQLATFSRLLGIPVLLATNRNELSDALNKLSSRKLVLIDTAGMSQRDMGLSDQFSTLNGAGHNIQVYLALSAIAQKEITDEIVRVFSDVELAGTIITKVDEAVSLGAMLGTLIRYRLPTMFISNGQHIPEDIQLAKPIELVKIGRDLMEQINRQQAPPISLMRNREVQKHA